MLDVVCEFVAEVLDETAYRHGGGVAQGANGAAHDVVSDRVQDVQVFWTALAIFNARQHAVKPARAFAAVRALAAAFLEIEIGQTQQGFNHAAGFVHYYSVAPYQPGPVLPGGVAI